jgi:hypothetical protein
MIAKKATPMNRRCKAIAHAVPVDRATHKITLKSLISRPILPIFPSNLPLRIPARDSYFAMRRDSST